MPYLLGLLGLIAEFGQYVSHVKVIFTSKSPDHERMTYEDSNAGHFRIHQQMQNLSSSKSDGGILCHLVLTLCKCISSSALASCIFVIKSPRNHA